MHAAANTNEEEAGATRGGAGCGGDAWTHRGRVLDDRPWNMLDGAKSVAPPAAKAPSPAHGQQPLAPSCAAVAPPAAAPPHDGYLWCLCLVASKPVLGGHQRHVKIIKTS